MAETKLTGTYDKVPGGYSRRINDHMVEFIPDFCVSSFENGTVSMYCPDYEAIEAAKAPAVEADNPGEYLYYYETQKAPKQCDFSAQLSYYGDHYYLSPLHDGLPQLKGRGIKYESDYGKYIVTEKAYEKLCKQFRMSREMCFD